jgi:hypothetical protein
VNAGPMAIHESPMVSVIDGELSIREGLGRLLQR